MISMIETFLLVICYSKELNYLLLKFLTATLAIILLIACSKEKKALKHLPGEWDMIGWVVDSSGVEINLLINFNPILHQCHFR